MASILQLLLDDVLLMIYWQTLFLLPAVGVVVLGIRRGLGLLVWLSVPCLFALLAALVQFSFDTGDIPAAQEFLFSIKPIDFSWHSMLVALGQALFTLGVGVGTGISYGAYAPERLPIGRSVMAVAVFDTAIALMAGLAIFPIVFANNMEPSMGPGLMFVSLPYAFGNIMHGRVVWHPVFCAGGAGGAGFGGGHDGAGGGCVDAADASKARQRGPGCRSAGVVALSVGDAVFRAG